MDRADHRHVQEIIAHLSNLRGNVPMHRKESIRSYSFSGLPFTRQLEIWDALWNNEPDFWYRLHAFFFLERHIKNPAQLSEMWPVIVRWQDQADDWGPCDALAKIYTKILEIRPDEVYAQLRKWNTDKNLWKRRQSLVSLLYYSRTKKQYPGFHQIEQLITPLLHDKEYYVQKGLGWCLRETHNVYPKKTMAYLRKYIKQVSPIAFTIAIEKVDETNVNKLKALRKIKT